MHEKLRLWSEVKDAVGDSRRVIAGSGDNCTADSIEFSREAARTGVDALLLTTPYYNKPTQEGMYRHFAAIAEAVDLPCIPYNIPGRTGVNMTAETQVRLSRIGNIVGVKESSADMAQIAAHHRRRRARLQDLVRQRRGHVRHHRPRRLRRHQRRDAPRRPPDRRDGRGAGRGPHDEAAAIHRRLLPLIDALFCVTNPIPLKFALNQLGFDVGGYRLPALRARRQRRPRASSPNSAATASTCRSRCSLRS